MQLPATARRVEHSTDERLNEAIRARTDAEVVRLESASAQEIAERQRELDEEWDVERLLQVNASTLVMLGVLLGARWIGASCCYRPQSLLSSDSMRCKAGVRLFLSSDGSVCAHIGRLHASAMRLRRCAVTSMKFPRKKVGRQGGCALRWQR